MTKRGREVIVKEFRLKNKDEIVKALKDLGFTVKVEREEERLYDEEEDYIRFREELAILKHLLGGRP